MVSEVFDVLGDTHNRTGTLKTWENRMKWNFKNNLSNKIFDSEKENLKGCVNTIVSHLLLSDGEIQMLKVIIVTIVI